jgi:transposase
VLSVDRRCLPKGQYDEKGFEVRQVVDIDIDIVQIVTEYRAQVLIDVNEKHYTLAIQSTL